MKCHYLKHIFTQIISYTITRFLSEVSAKAERQGRENFLHFIYKIDKALWTAQKLANFIHLSHFPFFVDSSLFVSL